MSSPLDFPCPTIICGAASLSFPSVSGIIKDIISTLANIFLGNTGQAIKNIVHAIASTPDAKLNIAWFRLIYNQLFGLVLVLGMVTFLIRAGKFVFNSRGENSGGAVKAFAGFLKAGVYGIFLPAFVGFLIYLQDKSTHAAVLLANAGAKGPKWSDSLSSSYGVADLLGSIALHFVILLETAALWIELAPIALIEYVLVILLLLSFLFSGNGRISSFIRKLVQALAVTLLTMKPIIAFFIVICGRIIGQSRQPSSVKATEVALCLGFCLILPLFILIAGVVIITKITDAVNVQGSVFTSADKVEAAQLNADLNRLQNQRANSVNGKHNGGRHAKRAVFDSGAAAAAVWLGTNIHPAVGVAGKATHAFIKGKRTKSGGG